MGIFMRVATSIAFGLQATNFLPLPVFYRVEISFTQKEARATEIFDAMDFLRA